MQEIRHWMAATLGALAVLAAPAAIAQAPAATVKVGFDWPLHRAVVRLRHSAAPGH